MEKFSDLSNESSPNVALSESTASFDSSEERESEDSLQARKAQNQTQQHSELNVKFIVEQTKRKIRNVSARQRRISVH